jgi:hypothetical protein
MTLYTVMPLEVVMSGLEQMEQKNVDVVIDGIDVEVQPINHTQVAIVRIRSGNPQDYLNPKYMPGRIIELQPAF